MFSISTLQTLKYKATLTLCTIASAVICSTANAELRLLDDNSMSSVTGMAGITIDLETKTTIAEREFVDDELPDGTGGSLYWKDYSFSGIGGGLADNIRIKLDISSGSETLATGFSEFAIAASGGYLDATDSELAWAISEYEDGSGDFGKQYQDGDLLIHVSSTDWGGFDISDPFNAANYETNLANMKNAIDFHLQQGEFGIRASDGSIETTITESTSFEAYLGYLDILVTNNGNNFTSSDGSGGKPANVELGDSYIGVDVKFRVENGHIHKTNGLNPVAPAMLSNPLMYVNDIRIHNERGSDTEGSLGYASAEFKVGATKGTSASQYDQLGGPLVDGIAIYDLNVRADLDFQTVRFGSNSSTPMGSIYVTDLNIADTSLVVTAH